MSRTARVGRLLITAVAVCAGGAIGAALRAAVADLAGALGVADWLATAFTNTVGGLAIGSVFVHLEARYRAHARSRLADTRPGVRVQRRGWPLDRDETLDPVDLFWADVPIRLWSGFLVTGVLGGFTTFSAYAVGLARLRGETEPGVFVGALLLATFAPLAATLLGFRLGEWTLPDRSGRGRAERR